MKLLPLLLAFVLSLGVACSSEPAVPPPATPDVPTFSEGEAIGLVQGMLRENRTLVNWSSNERCSDFALQLNVASYIGEGKWEVVFETSYVWHVYEGSNAIQTVKGSC